MFTYKPHTLPQQFFIIGGGGTGGRLVPLLAQFIRSITKDVGPRGWLNDPSIIIVDDDVVETKNLIRQNFIQRDVGKNKAVVLAERYSKAFGVNIHPVVQRINRDTQMDQVLNSKVPNKDFIGSKDAMIFLCVDSVQARRDILLAFTEMNIRMGSKPYFVIDAGNEDSFGQVRFYHLQAIASGFKEETSAVTQMKPPVMVPERVSLPFIPIDLKYYDSIVDNQTASCADLDQTLAINAQMAVMMMGVAQQYLYFKPFTYSGRNFDLAGAGTTTWMTMDAIRRMTWFMKDSVDPKSVQGSFPPGRTLAAKPILQDYIKKNRDALTSKGIDPDTGKKFETFRAVSIIEDPKPEEVVEAAPVTVEVIAEIEAPREEMVVTPLTDGGIAHIEQTLTPGWPFPHGGVTPQQVVEARVERLAEVQAAVEEALDEQEEDQDDLDF